MTQHFHLQACSLEEKKHISTQKHVYECSQHHYSLQPQTGNNPDVQLILDKQNGVYMHAMEYYCDIKWSEALVSITTWVNPENTMLSERSQTQRPHREQFYLCEMSSIGKSVKDESKFVVTNGCGWGWRGYGESFLMSKG